MVSKLRVFVVLDPAFGSQVEAAASVGPVWMIDSDENRQAAKGLWASGRFGPTGVTVFLPRPLPWLLPDIDLHHPGWQELEFHGVTAVDVRKALVQFGEGELRETEGGFLFSRPDGATSPAKSA